MHKAVRRQFYTAHRPNEDLRRLSNNNNNRETRNDHNGDKNNH